MYTRQLENLRMYLVLVNGLLVSLKVLRDTRQQRMLWIPLSKIVFL